MSIARLTEALRDAQRLGMCGPRPVEESIAHSIGFVEAISEASGIVVDLGSGGGLPGLVIAIYRPDLRIVLVERRERRSDFLERAVRRLELSDRVTVRCADVERLVAEGRTFDVVTARGFGPPEMTLRLAAQLRGPEGRIVISEPPEDDRWPTPLLDELGLERHRRGPVSVFTSRGSAN